MMAGRLGWGLGTPPNLQPRYWGDNWDWVWVRAGRPAKFLLPLNPLPKPPLHPLRREMLVGTSPPTPVGTGEAAGVVLGGAFRAPRWGWRCPEPTRASSPARKKGKSWELKPFLHARPQQEPEENLLYGAKTLLGKILRDLFIFF